VVTGLPRSGTSMMMQMLSRGGIAPLTDEQRAADSDNPRGYFELEAATRLRPGPHQGPDRNRDRNRDQNRDQSRAWLADARGKAVKIVAQLLPHLPPEQAYRVLFMERDLDEVLASQQVMLDHLGRERARLSDAQLKQAYRRQLQQVRVWLARQPNAKVLFVSHRQAIEDPRAVAERVNGFLGGGLDLDGMAAVVEPGLYRQRAVH
jgi:hypothetical protein